MFRVILITVTVFLFAYSCGAQENDTIPEPLFDHLPEEEELMFVDPIQIMPKYKFGTNAELLNLIQGQLTYSENECLDGITVLNFTISKEGKVEKPRILRSVSEKIDEQLLTLIVKYEFEPAVYWGKVCEVQFYMPFRFD